MSRRTLTAWLLRDGRPGHDSQVHGLVAALGRHADLMVSDIEVPPLRRLLVGRDPFAGRPAPDLLIGAGHATHLPLLFARRRHGGRSVVLMRPSLPLTWFDLCFVPEHDGVAPGPHVELTHGVVNAVQPSPGPRDGSGLLLIGGPSRHHDWDGADLLSQVGGIVTKEPDRRWTLTTSRRTPERFAAEASALGLPNLEVLPAATTPPGWLARRLATTEVAWVSEDSVSMVYEALTGGAAVGLLALPPRGGTGRVLRGLDRLLADEWVTTYARWCESGTVPPPRVGFNEAERCAIHLLERWWPAN
jgi:mitochondrial fission protein ELM1